MKIFYCRVSTEEQETARQIETSKEINADKIYIDKASGKNTERVQLKEMLNFVRDGDTVICSDISRIARNTKDLLNIVEELNRKNVDFISIKENIDTATPQGKFMLTVFGAMAELERENILQRQAEGIAIAKANGKYKGRQPMHIDTIKFQKMCNEWRKGERTAVSIQREFNITATTFYRWIKEKQL
jgi:DNA invertase Pin-like site-specific DNA recombinase